MVLDPKPALPNPELPNPELVEAEGAGLVFPPEKLRPKAPPELEPLPLLPKPELPNPALPKPVLPKVELPKPDGLLVAEDAKGLEFVPNGLLLEARPNPEDPNAPEPPPNELFPMVFCNSAMLCSTVLSINGFIVSL